jgi:hypothetical protein
MRTKTIIGMITFALSIAMAAPAVGAVVASDDSTHPGRRTTISYTTTGSLVLDNNCGTLGVSHAAASGGGIISLYALSDATAAVTSGFMLGSFSASTGSTTVVTAGYPKLGVNVDAAPLTGTARLFLWCAESITSRDSGIGITSSGGLTMRGLEYIWAGGAPTNMDRPGGWQEFFFSDTNTGDIPVIGNDANPCTRALPCRTNAKALAVLSPGAKIIIDAGDPYNTATAWTVGFEINLETIGCPSRSLVPCVWITTTAADKATTKVAWGQPAGTTLHPTLNVRTTSVASSYWAWAYAEGLYLVTDVSAVSDQDGDGPESDEGGRLWCHNCAALINTPDQADNCTTAHDGSVVALTGNPAGGNAGGELCYTEAGTGDNKPVATGGGGGKVFVISRGTVHHEGDAGLAALALNACGGVCNNPTPGDPDDATVGLVLLGPHFSCAACANTTPMMHQNPDADSFVWSLVAFVSFDHTIGAAASASYLQDFNVASATERLRYRGYRNSYMTGTRVWRSSNLDPGADIDITEVGAIYDEPEGGVAGNGAILHIQDADWKTSIRNFRLSEYVYDNDDGGGGVDIQCYLEDGASDVNETTAAACQTAIAAKATGTWSVDGGAILAANQNQHLAGAGALANGACSPAEECDESVSEGFIEPFPHGIELPPIFGAVIRGVDFRASEAVPVDAGRL